MTQAKIQPTIDRVKKFFAELPYKNADGSTGLNMIAIVPPPMPKDTDDKDYKQLYEQGMPTEWRGLAHGILVSDSPGGGGQANRPDWCGTGYNWQTMVHELGHQFGLPHDPRGARTGSPFHPSLMNYDYSYQLGGKGDAIRYSDGRFAKIRMKETALDETLPFPAVEVDFLSKRPYYFKVKELKPGTTAVDWNRNGVFGEKRVRADINDGYSAALRGNVRLERSAGAPAMVALGDSLAVVYPELDKAEETKGFKEASLSKEKPGRLQIQLITNGNAGKPQTLVKEGVTGDPSVIVSKGKLIVAYSTADSYRVDTFNPGPKGFDLAASIKGRPGETCPTIVDTPHGLRIYPWLEDAKAMSIGGLPTALSTQPMGAAWNSRLNCVALVTVEPHGDKPNRLRIHHIAPPAPSHRITINPQPWKFIESFWVEGDKGTASTSGRPQIIFDPSPDRGPKGGYNIYFKGNYPQPNQAGLNYLSRQIADPELNGGWRTKMMGNEWAFSRSVCAVAQYKGDIAYAYRWSGGEEDGRILVSLRASGIEDEWVTDFDEVGFIFTRGLSESLRNVQKEQWARKKG